MTQIPFDKYWNTWSTKSPATMRFIPADFSINIGAYSFAEEKYTCFPFSRNTKLYEHHPNGDYCRLEVTHAGTVLNIEYLKPDPFTVIGRIRTKQASEWGLRFWVLLSFGFEDEGTVMKIDNATFQCEKRSYAFAVSAGTTPVRSAVVENPDEHGYDMENCGYYVPEKISPSGKWALFKYNLEQSPEICFAVNAANSFEEALKRSKKALDLYPKFDKLKDRVMIALPKQEGVYPDAIEAVRDVMAWNSVEDKINDRVFTSLTRYWIDKKFGGWFMWQDDIFYHALLNAMSGDFSMARENIETALGMITPDGNLACLLSEFTEWVDRSQPPIEAFVLWKYSEFTGDTQLLTTAYPLLKTTYNWWFENRDGNGNGLLEYGSSCNGHGHFTGSKLAAKDESAMDNSPMHDSASFIENAHTLNMEDIALNSLLALDGEIISLISEKLGCTDESRKMSEKNEIFKRLIDSTLWDNSRNIYANRHWNGNFTVCTPTSFYPLAAGIPNSERADKLIRHIFDENEFWTKAPLPSVSANESSSRDNVYWRGRAWAPLNFFTYVGLKRYRKDNEAHRLAMKSMEYFSTRWNEERACYENYNSFTGLGGDSVDADPFYGWGALLPLMWIMEHIDIDPWNGFHFGSIGGEKFIIRNLRIKNSLYTLDCRKKYTKLLQNNRIIFESDAGGRFRNFIFGEHYASVEIDKQEKPCIVSFPSCNPFMLKINGTDAKISDMINIRSETQSKVEIWY